MRILVHDFAGHPFQTGLSRELARRGHRVDHAHFAGDNGPKGDLVRGVNDPASLTFSPLGEGLSYSKSNLFSRRAGELAYGSIVASHIEAVRPDLVICGNAPTEVVSPLLRSAQRCGSAFVYWAQDLYGVAAKRILTKKLGGVGSLIGEYYIGLDRKHLHASDHIVVISDAFRNQMSQWKIQSEKVSVIPNWGAISEVSVLPRNTEWASENHLSSARRFLYAGTLAQKHNPQLLSSLAERIDGRGEVVVVSSGTGADWLREQEAALPALRCLPLQPIQVFSQVLASADVLLAVIEREASDFSVPSKILSYLCAGRPIVLSAPKENLAAMIVTESGAGRVVEPEDSVGFLEAALAFSDDPKAANAAGLAGRKYAEEHFNIGDVADRFESVFDRAVQNRLLENTSQDRETPRG